MNRPCLSMEPRYEPFQTVRIFNLQADWRSTASILGLFRGQRVLLHFTQQETHVEFDLWHPLCGKDRSAEFWKQFNVVCND